MNIFRYKLINFIKQGKRKELGKGTHDWIMNVILICCHVMDLGWLLWTIYFKFIWSNAILTYNQHVAYRYLDDILITVWANKIIPITRRPFYRLYDKHIYHLRLLVGHEYFFRRQSVVWVMDSSYRLSYSFFLFSNHTLARWMFKVLFHIAFELLWMVCFWKVNVLN